MKTLILTLSLGLLSLSSAGPIVPFPEKPPPTYEACGCEFGGGICECGGDDAARKRKRLTLCAFTEPAPSGKPSLAEFKMDDGSSVRMTLLVPAVVLETKWGPLTIPIADIRKIEFGLHVPADTQAAIDKSIKRLASESHKERETASADLLAHGHFALPSLRRAAKSHDQEVAIRVSAVLKQIDERLPAELTGLRDFDVIHTQEHPIHGKIVAPGIKASSPHFGTVDMQVAGIRTLSLRHSGGGAELVVDAGTHSNSLDVWLDTGVFLEADSKFSVRADGQIDLWPQGPGQYVALAKGYNTAGKGGQFMAGALVGKIGETGKAFFVGELLDGGTKEDGRLYLQITPSPWNNVSAGKYRVRIAVK